MKDSSGKPTVRNERGLAAHSLTRRDTPKIVNMKKKIVVLTGAGMSAESGINTFRDSNGLWKTMISWTWLRPKAGAKTGLSLGFLQQAQSTVEGSKTQSRTRDSSRNGTGIRSTDYHPKRRQPARKAGSTTILHLHGELTKVRSVADEQYILDWTEDLHLGETDANGHQLRPHIVWLVKRFLPLKMPFR